MSTGTNIPLLPLSEAPNECMRTMSSAQIADVTGKRHGDVVRDIKVMMVGLYGAKGDSFDRVAEDEAVLRHLGKSVTWTRDTRGYVSMFHLDEEHSHTLVTGYDVKHRMRVVAEWKALKAGAEVAPPSAPVINVRDQGQLAVVALQLIEFNKELETRAVEAEAKAAVAQGSLDRLGSTKGALALRDAGKTLCLPKCDDIFAELESRNWIYRRNGKGAWIGVSDKCNAKYLDHVPRSYRDGNGIMQTVSQVVVTPKGLAKLATIFGTVAN